MTEFTLTSMNGEDKEFFLDKNSESGWYIDSDGDLIFVVDEDEFESGDVFAIVINGEGWNPGYTWVVPVEEVDEYISQCSVRPLKKLDIKYAV